MVAEILDWTARKIPGRSDLSTAGAGGAVSPEAGVFSISQYFHNHGKRGENLLSALKVIIDFSLVFTYNKGC